MSAQGNTDWIHQDESNNAIFTDTFIDEAQPTLNFDTGNPILLDSTGNNVQAIIQDVTIPAKDELVDSNGNPLPSDAVFSKIELRMHLDSAPSQDCTVYGFLLAKAAVIANVTWNANDGTSAWYPDLFGDGTNAIVHTDEICRSPVIGPITGDLHISSV